MHPLERQLRDAFGATAAFPALSRDEISDLKWTLVSLDAESAKRWIALVLIDEIYCPPKDGDALVYLLDGNMRARGRSERERQLPEKRAFLSAFTHDQALAVHAWFEQVASSKYRKLCSEDLASAVAYWSERVNRE